MHSSIILASMAADLSRYDDVLDLLTALPRRVPALRVVVVNGSAVTGGWDEHSDLDVEAWCDGAAAPTYAAVLALLRSELEVDHAWELPEATWPTGRQCFVHLQPDAADLSRPTRLLDVVVQTLPERLTMDTRRHGVPLVLHDPDGLLLLEDDDEAELSAQRAQAVAQTAARRQTAAWLVERAIARGDLAEATCCTCASPWSRWCGCCASSTARRATTSVCATCVLTCPPGWRNGWRRCCPGRTSRSGPGRRSRGRTRSCGGSPGGDHLGGGHFTKEGVSGGFHHSPL